MSDKTYVGLNVSSLEKKGELEPISRVTVTYDDDKAFTAGDDTGRTLEVSCPWGTQVMANNILASVKGYVYKPFEASGAVLDPAAELGDGVTIGGIYSVLAKIDVNMDAAGLANIAAPGEKEVDHEYPYLDPRDRELKRRVKLGQSYYGTKITRAKGLEIEKTDGETVTARVVLNADELSFYDGEGGRVLYFDPATGTYKFLGELNVNDKFVVDKLGNVRMDGSVSIGGSLSMTGSSNWLMTRYSANKKASVPDGWSEAWNSAWDNTSTQVWAIYSYNGGTSWTDPMLVQGKDGVQGPTGPAGDSADLPAWVKAYTSSAQFNTLITNEWVISMNLYGSKIFGTEIFGTEIFGGAFYDLEKTAKLVLNPTSYQSAADLVLTRVKDDKEIFKIFDSVGGASIKLYGGEAIRSGATGETFTAVGQWNFEKPPTGFYAVFA